MAVVRKLGFTCLIFLGIIGLVVDIGYGFFLLFDHRITTDSYNINDQTPVDFEEVKNSKNLTVQQIKELEDRKLFEVNLYSNFDTKATDRAGIVLEELKINHFTSPDLSTSSIVSSGMQYISDYNGKKGLYVSGETLALQTGVIDGGAVNVEKLHAVSDKLNKGESFTVYGKETNKFYTNSSSVDWAKDGSVDDYIAPQFQYYECCGLDGITWDAVGLQTLLKRDTELIIRIGDSNDNAYMIKLNKFIDTRYDTRPKNLWEFFTNGFGDVGGYCWYPNWDSVFEDIMHAVLTNNKQTGTHYGVVDLSNYFTVTRHYNTETEKWDPANEVDQQIVHAVVKFTYHTEGAVANVQSMFGVIDDNPRFKLNEETYNTDFAQAVMVLDLTASGLDKRYSETYQGYLVSLSIDTQRKLKNMPPYRVNVILDIEQEIDGKPIVGLDINAFDGFKLNKFTVKGNRKFYLLNNSLRDCGAVFDVADSVQIINVNSGVTL